MKKNLWVSFRLLLVILSLFPSIPTAQLASSETRILFQLQKLLEYPTPLQSWSNWTNFCYLPPSPSLKLNCTNNRLTELTVVGNSSSTSSPLSAAFSIESFFTVLTKLSGLKTLTLVNLGLWGPLPAKITRLVHLAELNISSNFINGSVPDLKGMSNLVSIVLRNNSIRSEVPKFLMGFDRLQRLDLSYNSLVGPIPSFLFALHSLMYLNLAQNLLSGALSSSTSCGERLRVVDVSRNFLIGALPSCIVESKALNMTVFDEWNCLSGGVSKYQHKYKYCHKEALAVEPPVKKKNRKGDDESKIEIGVVLCIIGGIVVAAALIGLLILVIIKKVRDRKMKEDKFDTRSNHSNVEKSKFQASQMPSSDARHVPQMMRLPTLGLQPYRVFTLDEIEDATNDFDASNLVIEGSEGQVYRGRITEGAEVLVKCVKLKRKNTMPQNVAQNVEALSKLRHMHLVSVLGHCTVTNQGPPNAATTVFIVLENISNGSLKDHLTDWRKKEWLKWPQRMAVTIGIARGVQFLHTGVAPGIFGNNLTMDNILLDETVSAKISNYNLPFQIGSEKPKLNAEAEKEDIYQLGVILLQVLTGKLGISTSELNELKLELEKGITEGQSRLRLVTDPSMQGSYAYPSLKTVVEITINCLCSDPSRRPSIDNVLWNLQYAIQVQEGWTSSGNLSAQL